MRKKAIGIGILLLCLLAGCKKTGSEAELTPFPTTAALTQHPSDLTPTPTVAPRDNMEVVIYSINSDTMKKEAVSVLLPTGTTLTPELIVEQVVDAMEDEAFYIGIDEITTENEKIIVSFRSDTPPVSNVGAGVETEILDAIGQSLLENLPTYSKIVYRIEGKAYKTGHLEFGIDEVYIGR